MGNLKQSIFAGLFSIITIAILTFLTYKTEVGIFLLVLLGIYPNIVIEKLHIISLY